MLGQETVQSTVLRVATLPLRVEQNGGYIHPSLELSTGSNPDFNIRGLFSTTFIPKGEVLVALPQDLLLCAFPDDDTHGGDETQCRLIYQLVEELNKGEQSRYWPYLSSMDDHEIDIPAVWSREERQLLSGNTSYTVQHKSVIHVTQCCSHLNTSYTVQHNKYIVIVLYIRYYITII